MLLDAERIRTGKILPDSMPLHQAASAGHEATVRFERGARLDLKDTVWQGTPEGWASHGGQTRVAHYLRAQMEQVAKH